MKLNMLYEFETNILSALSAIDRTTERIGGMVLNTIGSKTWTDPQGKVYPISRGYIFDITVPEDMTLLQVGPLAYVKVPKTEIDTIIESIRKR